MTDTNIKHAVFQTSRHGDGSAKVQIVGHFGTFGIVVPAAGNAERMTEAQQIEALRNAHAAMGEAAEHLKAHIHKLDPDAEGRGAPEKPKERIPLGARFA